LADRASEGLLPRLARLRIGSRPRAATLVRVAGMLAIVALAEAIFLLAGLLIGAVAALAALAILLGLAALYRSRLDGHVAIALSVIPLMRLLSIALPSVLVPAWIWHAEIGIPVILATLLAARIAGIGAGDLGLRRAPVLDTVVAAAGGLVLGYLAGRISDAIPILPDRSIVTAAVASIAVVVGAAAAEEVLFRGLLLRVADQVVAGSGVVVTTLLSTLLYLATMNARYILFVAAVSLVFGILTRRSGSLGPAFACHATLIWSQLILWPALLR